MKNKSSLKGCIELVCVLLLVPGILLAIAGIGWWKYTGRWATRAAQAEGTVTELVENNGLFSPVIEYTDHLERQHQYRSTTSTNPPAYSVGDKVEILYERSHPDTAAINHWLHLYLFPLIFGILAVVDFVVVAGLYILGMLVAKLFGNRESNVVQ